MSCNIFLIKAIEERRTIIKYLRFLCTISNKLKMGTRIHKFNSTPVNSKIIFYNNISIVNYLIQQTYPNCFTYFAHIFLK